MFIGQQPPSSNPWTTLRFYPSTSRTIGNKYTKQNHCKVCSVIKSTIYIRSRKSYIFPLYLLFSFFPLGVGMGMCIQTRTLTLECLQPRKVDYGALDEQLVMLCGLASLFIRPNCLSRLYIRHFQTKKEYCPTVSKSIYFLFIVHISIYYILSSNNRHFCMTNVTGSKMSIFAHPGKITGYWITTRSFPYRGPY